MRSPKALVLLVLIAALTGCSLLVPHPRTTSHKESAVVFKTDAAALAAAKEAYAGYSETSDAIARDGGLGTSRLVKWAVPPQLTDDFSTFLKMRTEGHRITGAGSFYGARLQSSTVTDRGTAVVVLYLCSDVSGTVLLDSTGHDIGEQRLLVLPLVVTFVSDLTFKRRLVVERSDVWDGTDFCQAQ